MVRVTVTEGLLEGESVVNEYGGTFYSFKGIPYAEPPIGNLRFKAPQPPKSWTGVRSAKEFGPACFQGNFFDDKFDSMSEDCLYLNVYTPDIKPTQLLPVMVWIHGGAFVSGSGNDDYYGPEFLIRHGVIIVTLNYRLEALGFLCLHTTDIPGNAGVKDQVAALRWVKKNIGNFGGDPGNITIFGESAGAACVSYHLISPMSRNLFRRAIAQSGGVACWWAQSLEPRDKALLLAKQLGCNSEDDNILAKFLEDVPVQSLINLKLDIWTAEKPYEINISIVVEKDFGQERFFYGDVTEALRNEIHEDVEILTGHTKDEGLITLLSSPLENMMKNARLYNEFFVPVWIKRHCVLADQFEVGRSMRQFYFKGGDVTEDGVLKFLNMDMFVYGSCVSGKFYSRRNKVYFYKFNCLSERNISVYVLEALKHFGNKPIVCHGDDIAYLFPGKMIFEKLNIKLKDFKHIDRVTTLWTNFAKYGNPTPDKSLSLQWTPYTIEKQDYLDIGNELTMKNLPEKEEVEFWDSIFKEYLSKYIVETQF